MKELANSFATREIADGNEGSQDVFRLQEPFRLPRFRAGTRTRKALSSEVKLEALSTTHKRQGPDKHLFGVQDKVFVSGRAQMGQATRLGNPQPAQGL